MKVRMVTGDNLETAKSFALKTNILKPEEVNEEFVCMTGAQFRNLVKPIVTKSQNGQISTSIRNGHGFGRIADKLKVLARASPDDKLVLVNGLKELGKTVAFVGDGTNDAPALSGADAGIVFVVNATDVSMNAASLRYLGCTFGPISSALKYGRSIDANLKKYLQYQLTFIIMALLMTFLGSIFLKDLLFNAFQLLLIAFLINSYGLYCLTAKAPSDKLMQ